MDISIRNAEKIHADMKKHYKVNLLLKQHFLDYFKIPQKSV